MFFHVYSLFNYVKYTIYPDIKIIYAYNTIFPCFTRFNENNLINYLTWVKSRRQQYAPGSKIILSPATAHCKRYIYCYLHTSMKNEVKIVGNKILIVCEGEEVIRPLNHIYFFSTHPLPTLLIEK